MTETQAEQMPAILKRLGGALIAATPEWWKDATLRVEMQNSAKGTAMTHSIQSEQHPRDIVVGTDDMFTATREFQLLSDLAGKPWAAFVMQVRQEGDDWKFSIRFEYAT